jgi:hypothetical protein
VHICRVKGWKHVWKPDPSPVRPIIWHAVSLWKHNQCMTSSVENRGRFYSMGMLRRTPWIAGFRSSRRLQRSSSSSQDARVKEVRVASVCVSRLDNPLKYGLLAVPTADNMIR